MSHAEYDAATPAPVATSPTTTRYPWRATLRTVAVAGLALLPVLPDIARAAEIETVPMVVTVLAVSAAIQRIISQPTVEEWMSQWLPELAAAPPDDPQSQQLTRNLASRGGRHRKE